MSCAMKSLHVTLLPIACLALSACNQYLERKDTITMSAGDAVAANEAAQVIDPWPRHSQNNNIPMDGVKAQRAIQQYRSNGVNGQPPSGGPPSGGGGPGAPPPTY
jgi:type IV pilus biogenesis protein CpaD/CtpE